MPRFDSNENNINDFRQRKTCSRPAAAAAMGDHSFGLVVMDGLWWSFFFGLTVDGELKYIYVYLCILYTCVTLCISMIIYVHIYFDINVAVMHIHWMLLLAHWSHHHKKNPAPASSQT